MAFVQDFKIVDRTFEEVASRFTSGVESLLGAGLVPARSEGERLRLKVAPRGWPAVLARTVEICPGPVRTVGDSLIVAFSWEAAAKDSLFPHLDADIEVAPFGLLQSVIAIHGRYEPPAGTSGAHADELLLHRLAESTVRAFLDGVCASVGGCTVVG